MPVLLIFSAIVINEVMSNPAGLESGSGSPGDRNEFIEILNIGNDTIDISQFFIADRTVSDAIEPWTDVFPDTNAITGTTLIPPGFYGVILDPEYVDSGDGIHLQPYRFTDSTIVLRVDDTTIGDGLSSKDTVYLINHNGDTIDIFVQGETNKDGFSYERINPYLPADIENTGLSVDSTGSTPGRRNSIYIGDGIYISSFSLSDTLIILALKNPGIHTVEDTLIVFDDYNRDGDLSDDEVLFKQGLSIPPGDTIILTRNISLSEGVHPIRAKTSFSSAYGYIRVGDVVGDVVINEIMAAPEMGCEWIELYNTLAYPVSIGGWLLEGETLPDVSVPPLGYLIVADDSTEFFAVYGMPESELLTHPLSLSNEEDSVLLFTGDTFCMDRVAYTETERGYSIERLNPLLPSGERASWSWSVYPGGTPGRQNSVFTEKNEGEEFNVYPSVFTPDGDGRDEVLLATIPLPFVRNHIEVSIFDLRGRRIYREVFDSGGDVAYFRWDGRKNGGGQAEKGVYILYVCIKDFEGIKRVVHKKTIAIGRR